MNPHGFFGLSSVVGTLRNGAWLRLDERRSGGGKARRRCIHTCIRILGGARPVTRSMPHAKGYMAHSLRLASWEQATPASFDAAPLGTYPRGGGFSWSLFSCAIILPKAVDWLPVPSQWQIASTLVQRSNVFTRGPTPRNPYVIQLFKVLLGQVYQMLSELSSVSAPQAGLTPYGGLKPRETRLTTATGSGVACGGFRSVRTAKTRGEAA